MQVFYILIKINDVFVSLQMLYPDYCGKYMKEREKVNRDFIEKTNFLYEDLYQGLSNYTGATITEPSQVKKLWNLLLTEV